MATKYKQVVDCFSRGELTRFHKTIGLCASLHQFVYGIEISQNGEKVDCCIPACNQDCFGIRLNTNNHQKRISNGILASFENKMKTLPFNRSFVDFEDLFNFVANSCGLKNGHCLLVYDFCLRMGYHLKPQVLPHKYVYLFRGAKKGADAVLGKSYQGFKLPTGMLQDALNTTLKSYEIEDLLCVCNSHLEHLGPISKKERTSLELKFNIP